MDGAAGQTPAAPNESGSLFPIKTGNFLDVHDHEGSEVGMKTQTVGAHEMVGGTG